MQNKPTPAPIFNYRKRPRQAVFADPQNDPVPGPSGAAAVSPPPVPRFSDLMPPQGPSYGRNQKTPTYQGPPARTSNFLSRLQKTVPIGNVNQGVYRKAGLTNSGFTGGLQQRQAPGNQGNCIGRTNPSSTNRGRSNNNYNPRPSAGTRYPLNKQQPYSAPVVTGQRLPSFSNPGPYGDMGPNRPSLSNTLSMNQQTRIGVSRNEVSEVGGRNDTQPKFRATASYDNKDDFHVDRFESENQIKLTAPAKKPVVMAKKSTNDFEKGLHCITCNVAGLRRWNKFKDNIYLLFEAYGYLDSAVTKQGHDCREFLLKDERKDAVKCAFYEIDRQLPKLTRGQWIRCVGTLDARTNIFKVVSIRQVQEAEKRLSRVLINKSDEIMHRLTKNLRES